MKLFAILSLLALCGAAHALPISDLKTLIRPGSKYSYVDALKQVCHNVEIRQDPSQADVSECATIRSIGSDKTADTTVDDGILQSLRTLDARIPGQPQLLLMYQIKEGDEDQAVPYHLALFDIVGAPHLLDVVEAPATPNYTGDLWSEGFIHLGPVADAFVFETFHSNSQQGYHDLEVLFVNAGKIRLIDSLLLLKCRSCADGNFEETAAITTAPDPGSAFNRITFRVTLDLQPDDPGTDNPKRIKETRRVFTATYRWDAAKQQFFDAAKSLVALQAFNERNL